MASFTELSSLVRLLLIPFITLSIIEFAFSQQEQKPTIWEVRARETLTPLTSKKKMDISQAQPARTGLKKKIKAKNRGRILVFWRCEGFIHKSITAGNFALQEMARKSGAFSVEMHDNYSVLDKKNLRQYDAILFNNTTHLELLNDSQREAILSFVEGGKGIIGIHAASDNFYKWKEGAAMIGGQFNGHPWGGGGTWAFKLDDPSHILNQAFGGQGFWHTDEIYQYKPESFQGDQSLRILVSLDMSQPQVKAAIEGEKAEKFNADYNTQNREVPVSWIRQIGKGRLFYTNFGHNETTYMNHAIMKHLFDGILYAVGALEADATPTAAAGPKRAALAPPRE